MTAIGMDWPTLGGIIDRAVSAMQKDGVRATPQRIEAVVNACGSGAPSLKEATAALKAATAKLLASTAKLGGGQATATNKRDIVAEVEADLAKPEHAGEWAVVNDRTGTVRRFLKPVPYHEQAQHVPESDHQTKVWISAAGPLYRLKKELDLQQRLADDRHASTSARDDAQSRASSLQREIDDMLRDIAAGRRHIDGSLVE